MELIEQLERTRDETIAYFDLAEADLALTYAPGKWSVRYLLLHLADSETVLFDRIRRVLSEPRQVLWVYDRKFDKVASHNQHHLVQIRTALANAHGAVKP